MAGTLLQTPVNGAGNWTDWITQMEKVKRGFFNIDFTTLTDGATAPEIEAGSWIDVDTNMYTFGIQEAATGWGGIANSTEAWMKVVPAGTAITAEFTDTPPTFDALKNGWYDTDDRYVLSVFRDSGGDYADMGLMPIHQSIWDKNGNEVISMLIQTKSANINTSVTTTNTVGCTVSGLDFTPDALLSAVITLGAVNDAPVNQISYPGTPDPTINVVINSVTFGANSVTITIENNEGSTRYIEDITVTVAKTS